MPDYRPLPSFTPAGKPVLYVDASQNALELYESAQERLDAARQLALVLLCSDQQLDDSRVFAAFHLLLSDAAGLYEAAFAQYGRRTLPAS